MRLITLVLLIAQTSLLLSQKPNCQVINYDTKVVFNGRKITETVSLELQINNAAGTEYAEISIPYSNNNRIENLEAAIYDIFGNQIRKLKKKDITIETPWSNIEFHSDTRLQTFKLIHTRYPYILKYKFTHVSNNYISLARWNPIFSKNLVVKNATLTVEVPKGEKVKLYEQMVDSAEVIIYNEKKAYQWSIVDFKPIQEEAFSLHVRELNPYVIVMPQKFHYGVDGVGSTWKDFGNWKCKLIDYLDVLTEDERQKIHQLTDTIISDIDKVKAIYHYMQDNTRYINVSEDIGGLLPHSASYVCSNRYGDCKALSNYTKSLLNEIGISSYYTTIYAGDKPVRIITDFPTHQSNHIVLCVPLNNDTLWLECTDKTAPFNYLGAYTQNRYALLNKKDNSDLVKTPIHTLNDALESYTTSLTIGETIQFETSGMLRGQKYDSFKGFDTHYSFKDKEEYIDRIGFSNKTDIQSFEINRPHRDSAYLYVNLKGNTSQITEKLGDKILLTPLRNINYKLSPVTERKTDIFVYYPINKSDTIIYNFDKSITKISGITKEENNTKFGSYKRNYKIKNNQLIIYRSFQLKQDYYDFGEYEDFYEFVSKSCYLDRQKTIITF